MNKHVEAGGQPYVPNYIVQVRQRWNTLQGLFTVRDAAGAEMPEFVIRRAEAIQQIEMGFITDVPSVAWDPAVTPAAYMVLVRSAVTNKDRASFEHEWQHCDAKEMELRPNSPTQQSFSALRQDMLNEAARGRPFHGFQRAKVLNDWRRLRRLAGNIGVASVTRARFEDVHDYVLDFSNRFGFLVTCLKLPGTAAAPDLLTELFCQALVTNVQSATTTIGDQTWTLYGVIVSANLNEADKQLVANRRISRDPLVQLGLDYPPHEDHPNVETIQVRAENLGFGGDRVDIDGDWTFVGTAGEGAFGHAGMWVRYAPNTQNVLDRKVVKETYLAARFDNEDWWMGDMFRRVVKEEHITRELSGLPNSQNIVRSEAYAIYEQQRMHRM